jgi:hypothetical protein
MIVFGRGRIGGQVYYISIIELRGGIQKFPDLVDNERYAYNNKHSRSNTKGYGGRTHKTDSQLDLLAESCTICRSLSRRPVRKLLDTPSYFAASLIIIYWIASAAVGSRCKQE